MVFHSLLVCTRHIRDAQTTTDLDFRARADKGPRGPPGSGRALRPPASNEGEVRSKVIEGAMLEWDTLQMTADLADPKAVFGPHGPRPKAM